MQIWSDEWRNSIISLKLYTPVFHMKFINNSVSNSHQEEQYVSYNILAVWTQYNKKICQAKPYNKMMFPSNSFIWPHHFTYAFSYFFYMMFFNLFHISSK